MNKELSKNHPKKSLLGCLKQLKVGETLTVPVERISYLRAICTNFGVEWDRKFTTSINREARTITATRLA